MKFNVGDRVRVCYAEGHDNVSVGECGTVVEADLRSVTYAVRFDERDLIGKHNCDGLCEDGYGWWCDEDMLEPAKETKFKVGDRVRVCDARDSDEHVDFGECGVVRGIHPANDYHHFTCYSVQFDKFNKERHTCLGLCDEGHGWNCDENMLEPASASAFRGGKIPNVSFADTRLTLPRTQELAKRHTKPARRQSVRRGSKSAKPLRDSESLSVKAESRSI